MATPLQIWQEKKLYFEQQLAIISDFAQKFVLRKQIEECDAEIAKLSNLDPQTHQTTSTENQEHQYPKQDIPQITFNTPQVIDVRTNKLKEVISQVQILLLTVNEWERKALLSEMTPLDGEEGILQGALSSITYRIGMFGNYCAAYTESTMGSLGRQGATLTAERAINELKPKAVFLLGIAFGIDRSKQKLGDVLIADSIQPYELQKVHNDLSITYRGQATPCGHILSERFRMRRSDWIPKYGDTPFNDVKVHQGLVLSGDKLVNNKDFRDSLLKAFPTAIGGEMEGAGAYSCISSLPKDFQPEVILIKSICDWADGHKNDTAQPFAAFTAISLAKHVLSKPDVLHPLIDSHNKGQLNNQSQTSDTSIKLRSEDKPLSIDLCPYKGLAPFTDKDEEIFFGRENYKRELLTAVGQKKFISLIGASGSGKSSLVQAGLIAELQKNSEWLITSIRPGRYPLLSLATAVVSLLNPNITREDLSLKSSEFRQQLKKKDNEKSFIFPLSVALSSIFDNEKDKTKSKKILLFIDQFEELFTACLDKSESDLFLEQIHEEIKNNDSNVHIVVTLRSDFLTSILLHKDHSFIKSFQDSVILIGTMNFDSLKRTIENPILRFGTRFEDNLVDEILRDLGNGEGKLPLLEFAMKLLWENRENGFLTYRAYCKIGRVDGALAQHAEKVYSSFERN